MENKGGFKNFYQKKGGKYLFFFGFYILFFIALGIYLNRHNNIELKEENLDDKTCSISCLFNYNYTYSYTIMDNEKIINFSGDNTKSDYEDFENKYFLNYININQLMKKSKVVSKIDSKTNYELQNEVLKELLNQEDVSGITEIMEEDNYTNDTITITLDLHEYFKKDRYSIILNYKVGDKIE